MTRALPISRYGIRSALTRFMLAGLWLPAGSILAGADASVPAEPPYQVVDGKVDGRTFLGWRVFHFACVSCHGVGALGTQAGPNLVERISRFSPREFEVRVLNRYLIPVSPEDAASESGSPVRQAFLEEIRQAEARQPEAISMPRWESNPIVGERIEAIYAYLRARADGALGPDRPELLD